MDYITAVTTCDSAKDLYAVLDKLLSEGPESVRERDYALVLQEALEKLSSFACGLSDFIPHLKHLLRLADTQDSLRLLISLLRNGSRTVIFDVLNLLEYHVLHVLPTFISLGILSNEADDWADVIKLLGSLPDRVTPYMLIDYREVLSGKKFFDHVCCSVLNGLHRKHLALSENRSVSLHFYGSLVGKFCLIGQEKAVVRSLILPALQKCEANFVWRRLLQTLFKHIPHRAHEPLIVELLSAVEDGRQMVFVVGYDISEPQLSRLLTKTIFFNKYFPPPKDVHIFRAVLQLFWALNQDRSAFKEVLISLAGAWGNSCAHRFLAVEYEMSLTKALILAAGVLRECLPCDAELKQKVLVAVLPGVEKRLKSTDSRTRRSGMVVGEIVTKLVDITPEAALKFEYVDSDDTKYLKSLMECRAVESVGFPGSKQPVWTIKTIDEENAPVAEPVTQGAVKPLEDPLSEAVDSDDDLVPYSNTVSRTSVKTKLSLGRPQYLQDCYDGLINKEDPARRKVCLESLAGLLEKQKDTAEFMVDNFLQVLYSIELEGSLADCSADRSTALIRIALDHPKISGCFYGKEVRMNNYGLGARLEMLQVIRAAANELSHSVGDVTAIETGTPLESTVDGKTRRFASATKISHGMKHRFVNFARFYIMPLISTGYTPRTPVFLLQQEDAMLLSHLVQTLTLLMHYAEKLPETPGLCLRVIEYVWDLKDHHDPAVKQAVLVCLAVCVQAVPLDFTSANKDFGFIDQLRQYLSDVKSFDPNSKCAELASQVQKMLDHTISSKIILFSGPKQSFSALDINRRDWKPVTLEDVKRISSLSNYSTFWRS
ncbi:telomere length regulation protein TEL2 homolog [Paramacrobiotus metropolitanus]|uniref:telomere length regulation protein TEL2 homolog n=1 Tax=Paramacrobiotus metropolitanus TaxID=2943436 RepID=UPI00244632EE|nr:telomere length regulation protein TEL2 homolog [Paramacrobiotus metropolitanus]